MQEAINHIKSSFLEAEAGQDYADEVVIVCFHFLRASFYPRRDSLNVFVFVFVFVFLLVIIRLLITLIKCLLKALVSAPEKIDSGEPADGSEPGEPGSEPADGPDDADEAEVQNGGELPNLQDLVKMPSPEGLNDEGNWRGNICLNSVHCTTFFICTL